MSDTQTKFSAKFWNKAARKYAARPVADEESYQHKLQFTRERFPDDARVFEFGCGTGSTAITHAPLVQSVHAIDVSPVMIQIAHERAAADGVTNVTFETGTIESFTSKTPFDVVLGLSILHLLPDRRAAIAKAFALLKPGGFFASSTACVADIMPAFRFVAPAARLVGLAPYVDIFSGDVLREEMRAAGFEIEVDWQPHKRASLFLIARKPA